MTEDYLIPKRATGESEHYHEPDILESLNGMFDYFTNQRNVLIKSQLDQLDVFWGGVVEYNNTLDGSTVPVYANQLHVLIVASESRAFITEVAVNVTAKPHLITNRLNVEMCDPTAAKLEDYLLHHCTFFKQD